jgi:hypothetical protein
MSRVSRAVSWEQNLSTGPPPGRRLLRYAGAGRELARLLLRPGTARAAREKIGHRLARRNELFLLMVQKAIWDYPASPYQPLLRAGGWTPEHLADSVRRRGLEATLRALRDAGVYLTHEEFKGRKPVQRGRLVLECAEADFDNPTVRASLEVRTGATRSQGSRVPASLEYLAEQRAPAFLLSLEALRQGRWPSIVWMPSVTHGGGLLWWLALAHMGQPPLRWFSVTDPAGADVPGRHRAMFRLAQLFGFLRGLRLPYPEHASLADPDMVLDAVLAARAAHGGCVVVTSASRATRLAADATRRGVHLEHVALLVGSEPLTPGRHRELQAAGAWVGSRYALTEAGAVGGTCGRPLRIDDVHLMADSFGLILNRYTLPNGQPADAFVLTTLLPSTPKVLLNVENDDFGRVEERRCGCLWDELGMFTHLSAIRSFSKLTGEGVTVLGTDCVRILEEVLPGEFGGRSTDYQLLEAEDDAHLTRLYLLVSPDLGPVDEVRIRARFMEELGDGRRNLTPPLWRLADTIQVVRRHPVSTATGKLFPFHTIALAPDRRPEAS